MNIEQAKRIPIEQLLQRMGHEPVRQRGCELWYLSPLRQEKTASFKVDQRRNRWYDFGTGNHGDGIDLLQQAYSLRSVPEALKHFDLMGGDVKHSIPSTLIEPAVVTIEPSPAEITACHEITAKSLQAYLRQRSIPLDIAFQTLKEIHYRRSDKRYFAIGFPNDSDGYELRTLKFKGSLGSKDITTIPGDPQRVYVFEGFFDYLAALTMFHGKLTGTAIVLNSVSLKARAVQAIRKLNPTVIELYPDNDRAGTDLLQYFQNQFPNSTIVDWSVLYDANKDLSEWHQASIERNI